MRVRPWLAEQGFPYTASRVFDNIIAKISGSGKQDF